MERTMDHSGYNQIHMQRDGIKICLLFPKEPENKEDIKKEVKSILSCALREHLEKNT